MSKPALIFFFTARVHTTKSTIKIRAEFPQFLDQGQSVGLLGRVTSSSQGTYTEKRTHAQTLNIRALSGIRTDGPGFGASEDSARLRPFGYRDRLHRITM
jgi:hypothetical protein